MTGMEEAVNFTTKFDPEDQVYTVSREQERKFVPCGFCAGTGKITGADGMGRLCPECYGQCGKIELLGMRWEPLGTPLTVGQIRVCFTAKFDGRISEFGDNYGPQTESQKEEYMMRETGIGSGRIYYVADLFATLEEAQQECDRRNIPPTA